jgi:hypothetical protein
MADNNNIPVSIDYTNRDFYSLRNDLVRRVQARLAANGKTWSGDNPTDFGLAMVESFAYVGDVVSYYIDRVANETNLITATQRDSLINIARSYGYFPAGYRQASLTLTASNPTANVITIPPYTQFSVSVISTVNQTKYVTELTFLTTSAATVPAADGGDGTVDFTAVHGEDISQRAINAADEMDVNDIAGELLGTSDGTAAQRFVLENTSVIDNTLSVYVHDGNYWNKWTEVKHLADYGPADVVYEVKTDENDYVTVIFGDGLSGAIPTINEPIKASYQIGGGLVGNIESGLPFLVKSVPSNSGVTLSELQALTISNITAGLGGEEPETNNSIRANAPLALRAMNRAVTLQDFSDLALAVPSTGKAKAYANTPNSIALYVGPQVSDISQDYFPGYNPAGTALTSSWLDIQNSVRSYISPKTQVGATLTVLPPVYVPVIVTIEFSVLPEFDAQILEQAIRSTIVYNFGYNYVNFNEVIYPEDIERRLSLINGLRSAKVINLYRDGGSPERAPLQPGIGELFVFKNDAVDVYQIGGLSSIVTSHGTLSPAFNSSTFDYVLTSYGSNSSFTVTPTRAVSGTTITVNGTVVSSGAASAAISTPVGETTIATVVATSADGTVSTTYTLRVTR